MLTSNDDADKGMCAGLFVPSSDVDLVIMNSGCVDSSDIRSALYKLSPALRKAGAAHSIQVRLIVILWGRAEPIKVAASEPTDSGTTAEHPMLAKAHKSSGMHCELGADAGASSLEVLLHCCRLYARSA